MKELGTRHGQRALALPRPRVSQLALAATAFVLTALILAAPFAKTAIAHPSAGAALMIEPLTDTTGQSPNRTPQPNDFVIPKTMAAAPPVLLEIPDDSVAEKAPPALPPLSRYRFGVGAQVAAGALPSPSFGVAISFGLERGRFGLDLEGRTDLPSSTDAPVRGTVSGSLAMGGIVPCVRFGLFRPCILALIGSLAGEGVDVPRPFHRAALHAMVGPRLSFEFPIQGPLLVRARGDLLVALTRTTLSTGSVDVWTTPFLSGVLGIDLLARFP